MIEPAVAGAVALAQHTDAEAVAAVLGPLHDLEILDVGCGDGENARELAARGARVLGCDPFLDAGDADGGDRVRLVRASADALPAADGSRDVVLFCFSLHHVPGPRLAGALAEARRVLRPAGRLVVAEPLAAGPGHYVSRPFHDETAVRAAAAAALDAHAAPFFRERRTFTYTTSRRWESFDAYAQRMIANRRYNGYTEEAVLAPDVRRRFDEMADRFGGTFEQVVRVDLFSGAKTPPR
jgi:ubiquinone/menaquinone biosynthesis C-methylase UbiE